MHRLPKGNRRQNKSSLYENFALPYIAETGGAVSVLDFGCGKGEYISRVVAKNAIGIEFYNQNMKSINVAKGNKQIDALIDYLKNGKLFDVVICDSVMNSVDSVQAETSVIVSLNSFCKNGGKLFISGRRLDDIFRRGGLNKDKDADVRYLWFLDKNNLSATYRKGKWYYQKYHSKEQIFSLLGKCGFAVDGYYQKQSTSWQVCATKIKNIAIKDIQKAIDFEFNLPLPFGKSYNRHEEVKAALMKIYRG